LKNSSANQAQFGAHLNTVPDFRQALTNFIRCQKPRRYNQPSPTVRLVVCQKDLSQRLIWANTGSSLCESMVPVSALTINQGAHGKDIPAAAKATCLIKRRRFISLLGSYRILAMKSKTAVSMIEFVVFVFF
jgi:hypothetical protein